MKSKADVKALMEQVFAECMATRETAHSEYAQRSEGEEDNALANFERGATVQVPREKVWYILTNKHWDGITSWINGFRSQREDIRGRIKDLIVYLVLLWAIADDEEGRTPEYFRCTNKVDTVQDGDVQCVLTNGHPGKHQAYRGVITW